MIEFENPADYFLQPLAQWSDLEAWDDDLIWSDVTIPVPPDLNLTRFEIAGVLQRILEQYRDSPRLVALLRALIDMPVEQLRDAFAQLVQRLNIDAMSGVQLDLIGTIVGRPRPDVFDPLLVQETGFFEFRAIGDANDPAKGFASLSDDNPPVSLQDGAPLRGLNPILRMGDEDYRRLLKATIFINNANATVPELEFYGSFVLDSPITINNGFCFIDLEVPRPLTIQERLIIENTLLPAAGILLRSIKVADGPGAFSFA